MITTVLWDVDGTLLDFGAAERAAIKTLFEEFGLGECTDEMIARYSEINIGFWQKLERNEITKAEVLVRRFEQFFGEYGVDTSIAPKFNERYQLTLGDTIVYRDDSLNIVKSLKRRVRQYVVSNGTVAAQTKKLERSKLGELMDGVFLSEELGVEKPNIGFFEKVFAAIGAEDLSEIMIVGDSLTSDIRGGMNAGIVTCWYDPENKPVPEGFRADHTISDLHELEGLLRPALHNMANVLLLPLDAEDREQFILDNQKAFNYGALVEFGMRDDHFEEEGEIISRETIEQSIDGGEALRIWQDGEKVGGAVINTDGEHGELELLFVSPEAHSRGIGYAAWCAIEKLHPEVKVWETVTPYFEKRNIHFYVNRCGFRIVEFYNSHHPDPNDPDSAEETDEQFPEGMFRFEKRME